MLVVTKDQLAADARYLAGSTRGLCVAQIAQKLHRTRQIFRDGRIVRMEYFAGWDEALEAAGLKG